MNLPKQKSTKVFRMHIFFHTYLNITLVVLDHFGPCMAILDHLKPFGTIFTNKYLNKFVLKRN